MLTVVRVVPSGENSMRGTGGVGGVVWFGRPATPKNFTWPFAWWATSMVPWC